MNLASSRSGHLLAVLGLLFTTLIWGGSFVVMKATIQVGLGVGAMLTLRFALAALAMGAFLLVFRVPFGRQGLTDGLWVGVAAAVVYWLNADGLRFTTATKSGFITGLYVLFTPLVGILFRERIRAIHGLGAVVAVAGLFLLVHQPGEPFGGWNRGDSETLGCAVASGAHIALIGRFSRRTNGAVLAFMQILVVMAVSVILTALLPASATADGTQLGGFQGTLAILRMPGVWVSLVYQGVLATSLAFFLMCTCQAYISATGAAIIYCLEAVFTALLAATGLVPGVKDVLSPLQVAGGALILAAMFLVELGPRLLGASRSAEDGTAGS
ncbi:MAG TPA: DMT family transporter [Holophaga sp.]|nr:DMT family transporter [Holophaga sp.]